MANRYFILIVAAAALLFLAGCEPSPAEPTPTISGLVIITPTLAPSSTATPVSGYPAPTSIPQTVPTEPTTYPMLQASQIPAATTAPTTYPGPEVSTSAPASTSSPVLVASSTPTPEEMYPGPAFSTPTGSPGYPVPTGVTPTTQGAYPGVVATPTVQGAYPLPGSTPTSAVTSSVTPPTPTVTATLPAIPEEVPPVPAVSPPPPGSIVHIWHSWSSTQSAVLDEMIAAFQDVYPDIRFVVTRLPQADLRRSYELAVYRGQGPDLLLAPAEWGPDYYDTGLVSDLARYASEEFLAGITPAALGTGSYQGALICLPVSQKGVVLFRNSQLISQPAETFDQLVANARATTRGGKLGAYFDRGAFFSAGNLAGLGGGVMDSGQAPVFNDDAGLNWLDLLAAYDVAGAVGMNTDRDLELFRAGRVGYIIEGTWQIGSLAQAIGEENLAIDPWPEFASGHLSGFVQAESIYLNPLTRPDDLQAALLFMGYLLTPEVQQHLAELGMIPVALGAHSRPGHVAQAAAALADGVAFPPVADPRVLAAYWEALEQAIQGVFTQGIARQEALERAEALVLMRLEEILP